MIVKDKFKLNILVQLVSKLMDRNFTGRVEIHIKSGKIAKNRPITVVENINLE